MKISPSYETVREIAATGAYQVLPVSCELLSDICTPMEALRILKHVSTHCYLLESVVEKEKWGRYTFLGYDPKLEITCADGVMKAGDIQLKTEDPESRLTGELTPLFDKETYCAMVEQAKGYIREGDIFQIVLSNRLSAPFEGSLLNTYRVLRTTNPSPYMFYFSGTDVEVAGASPETLVKLENGVLHTFPLAGLVKANTRIPCAVGFGISTPAQAAEMARHADGVIVGSAIVKLIGQHGREAVPHVAEYVKSMKDAIRGL